LFFYLGAACVGDRCFGDGPADNKAESVRPIPPLGIELPAEERSAIEKELRDLQTSIASLRNVVEAKGEHASVIDEHLPDVEIFERAVEIALTENGFFDLKDGKKALDVLAEGKARAKRLAMGDSQWEIRTDAKLKGSQVVRGFRSKLDGTVQPYSVVRGLGEFRMADQRSVRCDVWCRGRSEKVPELQFIAQRMNSADPLPENGVIMIHPFGRYCNANKLAGEVDTLEALDHAMKYYPIDPKRVAIRGFSMGGAAAWHLAVHYPDRWFAANPGAGFSETPKFLKVFQSEDLTPTWYEQKLWQWYDAPVWVRNLKMVPTVAYSGETDKQKQATDVMAEASWSLPEKERFELMHVVAANTAHQVAPRARIEIERRLHEIDLLGKDNNKRDVSFTTTTLKYNHCRWLTIHGLQEHWVPATVNGQVSPDGRSLKIVPSKVTELSVDFEAREFPDLNEISISKYDSQGNPTDQWQGFSITKRSDLSKGIRLRWNGSNWDSVSPLEAGSTELPAGLVPPNPAPSSLLKKHSLQGPIDDAFMDAFLFVPPSGQGNHPDVDRWVQSEMDRAAREWHRQMRGDVRIKKSEDLKPADIENYHLILWGDPASNPTIAKVLSELPIRWTKASISVGKATVSSPNHAPVLIYPNPMNPKRYVVLNSGFTYREYDYLNNARQVPKLPDWALVEVVVNDPRWPKTRWPGKIVEADFFGEKWEIKAKR
jgi:pimeloyl-ACP methyl ester carboxylesterase